MPVFGWFKSPIKDCVTSTTLSTVSSSLTTENKVRLVLSSCSRMSSRLKNQGNFLAQNVGFADPSEACAEQDGNAIHPGARPAF
jgi:hypothetical protein